MNTSHSHPLATESFSYSWLATPPSKCDDHQTTKLHEEAQNNFEFGFEFDFDINPTSKSNDLLLVDADKLFSNGLILPHSSSSTTNNNNNNNPPSHDHHYSTINISSSSSSSTSTIKTTSYYGRWCKLLLFPTRKIVSKLMGCMVPNERRSKGNKRVDDVNRRAWQVKTSINQSPQDEVEHNSNIGASPNRSYTYTDETSIYEAILYCKRSISVADEVLA